MAATSPSSFPVNLGALSPLIERRHDFLSTWREVVQHELGSELELDADEFDRVFDSELERLGEPDLAKSPGLLDAALQATASCFARRGVPLSNLLAMSAFSARAAGLTMGERLPQETLRALSELEAARATAYARAYRSEEEPSRPRCAQPLVTLRRSHTNGSSEHKTYGIVGKSLEIERVRSAIAVAAEGARNVLVVGEAGSGKELVARAIHEAAGGERSRFYAVSCASLPNHLVESELFGHVRGAFPGADGEYLGLFRAANGGTLFFDELAEMSPEIQAKLVRVLEERAVRPVGSLNEVPVDVRVIVSTSRDPAAAMAAGQLRPELYYLLQSLSIQLPPLRQRREDIPLLAEHFLATFCHRRCGCIWGISQRALDVMCKAEWPGNVRELRNAVEHAVGTGESGLIQVTDLPSYLQIGVKSDDESLGKSEANDLPSLAEAETELIRATLDHFGGNKVRAALSLGISRHKLYDRLRKLGIH